MQKSKQIRILVVDDHFMVRMGLSASLNVEPDMEVVAEAADGEEATEMYDRFQPDVMVLDLRMPKRDGVAVVQMVLAWRNNMPVVVATGEPFQTFGGSPLGRALNVFAFFTVQSNLIVGGTCLLLVLDRNRTSTADKAGHRFRARPDSRWLSEDFVDIVVRHQAEKTLVEILQRLEAGNTLDLVQGCWFKRDGRIIQNPDRPAVPL